MLPLVQVPPRGLWRRTGRTVNTTAEAWLGLPMGTDADPEPTIRRYLAAFGPATPADVRTWSWLTGVREVLERMRPTLATYRDQAGRELFDLPDAAIADPDLPAPVRFLPQYDNVFLSHDDRSRISGVLSWGLEFVWKGVVLVDGGITGAWRVRREGKAATMTIELGRALTPAERRDLDEEAERLGAFLDPDAVPRDPGASRCPEGLRPAGAPGRRPWRPRPSRPTPPGRCPCAAGSGSARRGS